MIIRTPSTYDLARAAKFLTTDEKTWETLVIAWMDQRTNNPNFKSAVALHEKQIVGIVTGTLLGPLFTIGLYQATTPQIMESLFRYLQNHFRIEEAVFDTVDREMAEKMGFRVLTYRMLWQAAKPLEDEVLYDSTKSQEPTPA